MLSEGDPARAGKAVEEHMAGSYVRLRRLELPSDSGGDVEASASGPVR